MRKFLESNFNLVALFITILTGIIFVTFFIMRKELLKKEKHRFNISALVVITLYEILQILLLIYLARNVIIRAYIIFICASLFMLFYIEALYFLAYRKYVKTSKNNDYYEEEKIVLKRRYNNK